MAIKADIDLVGVDPDVILPPDGRNVMISLDQVVHDPVARRSGKRILLGMTPADAMRLLAQLQLAQQQYGWPNHPGGAQLIPVPPDGQKN